VASIDTPSAVVGRHALALRATALRSAALLATALAGAGTPARESTRGPGPCVKTRAGSDSRRETAPVGQGLQQSLRFNNR